ncbi:hypothetical protein LSH36_888g00001 [Paralvinella palmiformis]|uniref:Uncharacterized protein n=1 Tax=Paralvinella palmiformis TaxID=53620 RepID=A0AAD9IYM3_9ANNE|nr:hypothetical protein LSH36_888g00001 [Paralvinella palmiformis]
MMADVTEIKILQTEVILAVGHFRADFEVALSYVLQESCQEIGVTSGGWNRPRQLHLEQQPRLQPQLPLESYPYLESLPHLEPTATLRATATPRPTTKAKDTVTSEATAPREKHSHLV